MKSTDLKFAKKIFDQKCDYLKNKYEIWGNREITVEAKIQTF